MAAGRSNLPLLPQHVNLIQAEIEVEKRRLPEKFRKKTIKYIKKQVGGKDILEKDTREILLSSIKDIIKQSEPLSDGVKLFYLYGRATKPYKFAAIWERYGLTREEYEELNRTFRIKFFWLTLAQNISTIEQVRDTLANLIKAGTPIADAIERITQELPGKVYYTETVFRTNATSHYNFGILDAFRDDTEYWEYSAILDDRTTEICRRLDGKILRHGSHEHATLSPPNHHNCRSVLLPAPIPKGEPVSKRELIRLKALAPSEDFLEPVYLDRIPDSVDARIRAVLRERDIQTINEILEELL